MINNQLDKNLETRAAGNPNSKAKVRPINFSRKNHQQLNANNNINSHSKSKRKLLFRSPIREDTSSFLARESQFSISKIKSQKDLNGNNFKREKVSRDKYSNCLDP